MLARPPPSSPASALLPSRPQLPLPPRAHPLAALRHGVHWWAPSLRRVKRYSVHILFNWMSPGRTPAGAVSEQLGPANVCTPQTETNTAMKRQAGRVGRGVGRQKVAPPAGALGAKKWRPLLGRWALEYFWGNEIQNSYSEIRCQILFFKLDGDWIPLKQSFRQM